MDELFLGESGGLNRSFAEEAASLLERDTAREAAAEHERQGRYPERTLDQFTQEWLDEPNHGRDVDRVLRAGYREAIELAVQRDLPIETFWVVGVGDEFEVHISEGKQSVVVHMFVPQRDPRDYGSRRATSRSWVVRVGDLDSVDDAASREYPDGENEPTVKIQVSGQAAEKT
jgi:hypothetical protein